MTDRHKGYIVTLAFDVRDDDAEAIITALRMVRGVISVEPQVADIEDHMARKRVRQEVAAMLYELVDRIGELPIRGTPGK